MTTKEFCFWLQGWFELNETIDHREGATKETLNLIKEKLDLVLSKKTDKQEETTLHTNFYFEDETIKA